MSRKNTILIVDDDLQNLQVLGNILRENKFNVAAAISGFDALEYVGESTPDLIILDVMMPEMDGFETCKRMKSVPALQSVPILFLSALDDVNQMIKGLEHGAFDYILKPLNASLLLSKIQIHLDLKNKTEELENLNHDLESKVKERTMQLEKANLELKKFDETKSEFLRIISHEIRTPLNGILGFINLLKQECQNDKVDLYIKHLDTSVNRLERFSLNALLYTQLNTGKYKLSLKGIPLKQLLEETISMFTRVVLEKKIFVSLEVPCDLEVTADQTLISECLRNILDNAVKYAPSASKIVIVAFRNKEEIICKITDQGEGFSSKALQNLFQLFKPGNVFVDGNEGVELALCKQIMLAHHGDIRAFNVEKGASVEISFVR
jgi:two-component system, sensor histidine kinase and response regulator